MKAGAYLNESLWPITQFAAFRPKLSDRQVVLQLQYIWFWSWHKWCETRRRASKIKTVFAPQPNIQWFTHNNNTVNITWSEFRKKWTQTDRRLLLLVVPIAGHLDDDKADKVHKLHGMRVDRRREKHSPAHSHFHHLLLHPQPKCSRQCRRWRAANRRFPAAKIQTRNHCVSAQHKSIRPSGKSWKHHKQQF